jgi:hypothetical protein
VHLLCLLLFVYASLLAAVRFIQDSSPAEQKEKVQVMTAEVAAALEGMLATAEPYWVCLRPPARQRGSSSNTSHNSIWLLNVPLLLEQNAALQLGGSYLLPEHVVKTSAAAAATPPPPPPARTVATAPKQPAEAAAAHQKKVLNSVDGEEADAQHSAAKPADSAAAAAAMDTADTAATALDSIPAAAAVAPASRTPAVLSGRSAAAHAAATAFTASNRANTFATAEAGDVARARAAASARISALFGPHQEAKHAPSVSLEYLQQLPGLGPVQVRLLLPDDVACMIVFQPTAHIIVLLHYIIITFCCITMQCSFFCTCY